MQSRKSIGQSPLAEDGCRWQHQQNCSQDSHRCEPFWKLGIGQVLIDFVDSNSAPLVQLAFRARTRELLISRFEHQEEFIVGNTFESGHAMKRV